MSTQDQSSPAFPHNEKHDDGTHWHTHNGMALRDYFAAAAMPAVFTSFCSCLDRGASCPDDWRAGLAKDAYMLADAMLLERKK